MENPADLILHWIENRSSFNMQNLMLKAEQYNNYNGKGFKHISKVSGVTIEIRASENITKFHSGFTRNLRLRYNNAVIVPEMRMC